MKIIIKSLQMDITDAIRQYIDDKLDPIRKFTDESTTVEVDIGRTTNHHKHGDIFRAEFNVTVSGDMVRTESVAENLYSAIDIAQDDLLNALTNRKGKKRTLWRKGAQRLKSFIKGLSKRKRK
jgi:putative sigma-54 modulation protein